MLNETEKQEVERLCTDLLKLKSYSGQEDAVVTRLKQHFSAPPFTSCEVDRYGSIVGRICGSRPGRKVLLDGHIDTVPANPDEWTHGPFSGERQAGRLFGRGASDMKGAVSAMICAVGRYARMHPDFAGEIDVACVVQEECFEGVASREISRRFKPDFVIIGESTGLNLNIGQRGRAEIVLETTGKPAHSSNPQAGYNAVYAMMRLLRAVTEMKPLHHDFLGDGIMELTDIVSSPYPGQSVVPSGCRVTFDRRLLVGETRESVLEPIRKLIAGQALDDPQLKADVRFAYGRETCYTGETIEGERFFPAWLADENAPYVQAAWNGLKRAGIDAKLSHYRFCTNGSHYAGEAGIKTLGFGPSYEQVAHTRDEYIETAQLHGAVEGYTALLESLI